MHRLVVLGDTHIGSTVALSKPVINLDDGGTYHASKAQVNIYKAWQELQKVISNLPPPKPVLVLLGDLVETDAKNRSDQVITRNAETLRTMAVDVLDEVAKLCTAVYVVRGTEAHTGKSASMDDAIGKEFGSTGPVASSHSYWWLPLEIEHVRVDIAHHANMSGVPWNKSSATTLASRVLFSCAEKGEIAPNLILRAHQHRWGDSKDDFEVIRAVQLPGWTFATAHIHKVNPGSIAEIGAAIINIEKGNYEVRKFKTRLESRQWIKI